jgi:hypothetical protein
MKRMCACFAVCAFIGCSSTSIKLGSYSCSLPSENIMKLTISDSLLIMNDSEIAVYKYNILRVTPLLLLEMKKEGSEKMIISSFKMDGKGYIYQINDGIGSVYCKYLQ